MNSAWPSREQRVERLIEKTISLCRDNHTGNYPGIVVNLLGDFVSGGIHAELKATDEEEVIPAALKAADWLVGGLTQNLVSISKESMFLALAGIMAETLSSQNSNVTTEKTSTGWLLKLSPDISVVINASTSTPALAIDVHYRVYGERYLACHGDMLGVRGGDGIIGSIGPIVARRG